MKFVHLRIILLSVCILSVIDQFKSNKQIFNMLHQNNQNQNGLKTTNVNSNNIQTLKASMPQITKPIPANFTDIQQVQKIQPAQPQKLQNLPLAHRVLQSLHQQDPMSDLEKLQTKNIKEQEQQFTQLQRKFKEISKKTQGIKDMLENTLPIKEIKHQINDDLLFKENASNFKYISKVIGNLENNLKSVNEDLKHISQLNKREISSVKNADVNKRLYAKKAKMDNLITSELKLDSTKLSENFVEIDNNFKIKILNHGEIKANDILNYMKLVKQLKKACGGNLDCFKHVDEVKEEQYRDKLIERTIKSIKNHLNSFKRN
jgi:hypothetical protein